jgi:error-prone DNA polymerase
MLPRLKPRKFYDLVIEVAIVRPGPIQGDMVHPYLKRREGSEKPDYPSEELKEVLAKTLGVPLFQEQCMRIAMVAADFSAAEADGLRRAMATFKKAGDIEQFEDMFIGRMVKKGYKLDFATRCFSQIKGFGTYGFPESHAASFAFLVYASAWIKCHHPDVFCAAILNSQPMGFYAPAQLVRDAREHGVEIRPVDVNHSRWDHALEPTGDPARHAVRLGFRIVAGLSRAEIEAGLIGHRETGYVSIADLVRRAGLRRSTLRRLAQADALGSLNLDRRQGLWALGGVDEEALPLFAHAPLRAGEDAAPIVVPAALPALPVPQAVAEDYAATGLSLKRHPLAFLRASLAAQGYARAADLRTLPDGRRLRIAGLVLFRQRPGTAKGTIFMTIEDETGAANLIVWPKISERFRRAVYGAKLLACTGRLQREGQVIHLVAEGLEDRTAVLRRLHRGTPRFRLPAGRGDEAVHAGDDMRLRSRDFR